MKRNSRLALAMHTLGHMAANPSHMHTSSEIAEHAGTNPVVVRRVLGKLREAGLLTSEKGHAGGWCLAREPHLITLADIYIALDERLISMDENDCAPDCCIEHSLLNHISQVIKSTEQSFINHLATTTIADVQKAKKCKCKTCCDEA